MKRIRRATKQSGKKTAIAVLLQRYTGKGCRLNIRPVTQLPSMLRNASSLPVLMK